jgi:hypothetical protein
MDMKSQFAGGASNISGGQFLLGSLSLAVADTRRGFTPEVRAAVDNLSAHAAAHPGTVDAENFARYVQKITPQAGEARPAAASRKPVIGVTGK